MDYLEEAKMFSISADKEWYEGSEAMVDYLLRQVQIYALIALVDRLDAMTTDGADGMKALNCVNFIANAPQQ